MKASVLTILSGGISRRYQNHSKKWLDKALMTINDEPLLVRLVREGLDFYQTICLSVNTEKRKQKYFQVLSEINLEDAVDIIVDDHNLAMKGVLKGITTIIRQYPEECIQFVSCDRPYLNLSILRALSTLEDGISVFQHDNGLLEPLLALFGPKVYLSNHFTQLPLARADLFIRLASKIQLYNTSSLLKQDNIDSEIFLNINYPIEINEKKRKIGSFSLSPPMIVERKPVKIHHSSIEEKSLQLTISSLLERDHSYLAFLWSFFAYKHNIFSKALFEKIGYDSLISEYKFWSKHKVHFLILHSLQDISYYFPSRIDNSKRKEIQCLKNKMTIEKKEQNAIIF